MNLLDQMKTFARIVETGHLSTAAKNLGLSVAAVSRQLGALERDLGTTLLVRSTRKLAVTDSGRRWYEHCARILRELDSARSDVAEGQGVRGRVVVSAPASFSIAYLASALRALQKEHPDLQLELRPEDQAIDLVGDGVDIAVRAGMSLPDSASIIARRLASFRRLAVASRAYLRRRGTPKHPRDLLGHDLLLHTRAFASFTRWRFERGEDAVELEPTSHLGSSSPIILRQWALDGAGIALLPSWFAGDLSVLLPTWSTPSIDVHALHRTEVRGAPRIRVVLDALAGAMAVPAASTPLV